MLDCHLVWSKLRASNNQYRPTLFRQFSQMLANKLNHQCTWKRVLAPLAVFNVCQLPTEIQEKNLQRQHFFLQNLRNTELDCRSNKPRKSVWRGSWRKS